MGGSGSNSDANGFDTLYLGGAGTYTLGLGQVNSIERFKLGNPEGTDNEASNLIATALPFDGGAIFEGNEAANVILSTIDSDTVMGNGGSDVLLALAGDDLVEGGEGVDIVFGDAITAGELATLVSLIGGQLNGLNLGGVDLGALLSGAGGLLDGVLGAVIGSGNDTLVGGNGIDLLLGACRA